MGKTAAPQGLPAARTASATVLATAATCVRRKSAQAGSLGSGSLPKAGQADVVELNGVDAGERGEGAGLVGEIGADLGVGGAEELVVGHKRAILGAEGGLAFEADGVPVGVGEGDRVVGAVEGPEPGDGAEALGVGPLGGLGDVGVCAAEDEGGDAGGLPGAEIGGGEVGIVGVDPEADGGREGLRGADGVGREADAAPVLGGVDGGLAGGGPDGVAFVAGGGVVDAREVHAHLGAGGRGRAGAGMVGVAGDGGPGPGDFDAPALVSGVVVEGALEGDGGLQALDVPIVQGEALGVAVGRGEEEVPDGAERGRRGR